MKPFDYILKVWRTTLANRFIPPGGTHLDIGCHDGLLLRTSSAARKIGFDKVLPDRIYRNPISKENIPLYFVGDITQGIPLQSASVDVVTMLAVYEHLKDPQLPLHEIRRILKPMGIVILTIPSSMVDDILSVFITLRLAEGISFWEHHRFDHKVAIRHFESYQFRLVHRLKFELGFNNLFVFYNSPQESGSKDFT